MEEIENRHDWYTAVGADSDLDDEPMVHKGKGYSLRTRKRRLAETDVEPSALEPPG